MKETERGRRYRGKLKERKSYKEESDREGKWYEGKVIWEESDMRGKWYEGKVIERESDRKKYSEGKW